MTDATTTTTDVPTEVTPRPTIELLGQSDAGGCCGGDSCACGS